MASTRNTEAAGTVAVPELAEVVESEVVDGVIVDGVIVDGVIVDGVIVDDDAGRQLYRVVGGSRSSSVRPMQVVVGRGQARAHPAARAAPDPHPWERWSLQSAYGNPGRRLGTNGSSRQPESAGNHEADAGNENAWLAPTYDDH